MHNPDLIYAGEGQTLHIQPDQVGERLDRYLVSVLQASSRTVVQHLIADGSVLVNGRPGKAAYILRSGDVVQVLHMTAPAQPSRVRPQELPLDIIYEDDDLVVINKAAGVVVHPAPGHHEDTLVNALLARYPAMRESEVDLRPGIVHRLDRDTSGLIIVAKNTRTQAAMVEQMKRHEVLKRYLALVQGVISLEQGTIEAPIGRNPRHRQQMAITANQGREARTHFRVLKRFSRYTLLLLELETGRTHQIRVHLQAIGHPVVGDPVYGPKSAHHDIALQRQFLHAYQLEFVHPTTGKKMQLEAPLPDDLQAVLDNETVL